MLPAKGWLKEDGKEAMGFVRQVGAVVVLLTLTLWFQCAGLAGIISLARKYIAQG